MVPSLQSEGTVDEGPYVCDVCGRAFASADALHRHIRETGLVE